MNSDDLQVIISDEIANIMAQRGIKENELKDVINYTLKDGTYLHTSDNKQFLAKKRLGNFTLYVEYVIEDGAYKVVNAYSHRISLIEDQ